MLSMYQENEINFEHDGLRTCHDMTACEKTITKEFDISVPFTIMPSAAADKPVVECVGGIESVSDGTDCDRQNCEFSFTVKQRIRVKIPIRYGASTCHTRTRCNEATPFTPLAVGQ
jgi:hypothetical protein